MKLLKYLTLISVLCTSVAVADTLPEVKVLSLNDSIIAGQRQVVLSLLNLTNASSYAVLRGSNVMDITAVVVSNLLGFTLSSTTITDTVPLTAEANFYRVKVENGILAWSTPGAGNSGGNPNDCPGPYIGYANYLVTGVFGWFEDTNNPPFVCSDANLRTDTRIQWLTRYGENGCDEGGQVTLPLFFVPPMFTAPSARFTVYYRTNLPVVPSPIRLVGFKPTGTASAIVSFSEALAASEEFDAAAQQFITAHSSEMIHQ